MYKILIYLIYFSFYSILILILGKGGLKQTETIEDFFIGGKSMKLFPSIFTFTATWFSIASMVGFTGSVYVSGYEVVLMSVVGWFLGAGFLVLIVDSIREYDLITIPEFFYKRYNSKGLQIFGGITIVFCYIMYMIIQITGFGVVISKLLEINYSMAIFMIYIFIIYTTYGGFFSVVKTDTINIIITIIGVLISAFFIINKFNSVLEINIFASEIINNDNKAFLDFEIPLPMIISTSFAWGLGLAVNPQYLIRISSTDTSITAKKMISYSVLILALLYFLLSLVGVGGRVLSPELYNNIHVDEVYSFLINNTIYTKLSGFILIGITAAAISSINSQLLIISSGLMIDVVKNIYTKPIHQELVLNISRFFIILAATVSLLLSFTPPSSLLIYGSIIWSIFSITFFLPIYLGSFWKKANKTGVIASIVSGLTVMMYFLFKSGFFDSNYSMHPVIPSFISALLFFYIFTIIGDKYENKT